MAHELRFLHVAAVTETNDTQTTLPGFPDKRIKPHTSTRLSLFLFADGKTESPRQGAEQPGSELRRRSSPGLLHLKLLEQSAGLLGDQTASTED